MVGSPFIQPPVVRWPGSPPGRGVEILLEQYGEEAVGGHLRNQFVAHFMMKEDKREKVKMGLILLLLLIELRGFCQPINS